MKHSYILIIAFIMLSSCGKNRVTGDVVDAELEQYARSFQFEMNVHTGNVSLKFESLGENTIGLCRSWTNGAREITIDPGFWQSLDNIEREQLMYHELGHCAMNLSHDSAMVFDPATGLNVEASIMNPYFFGDDYNWAAYRSQYKDALRVHGRITL